MLGPISAILLAILTTFLSNIMLGMGVWTVWQIISWGLIGVISGFIGQLFSKINFFIIVIYSIISGYFYGFVISLTTYQVTGKFWPRSEEHTSELQSRGHIVCRLLLQ